MGNDSEGQLTAVQCVRCLTINQRANKTCSKCGVGLEPSKIAVSPTMTREKTEKTYENVSVDPVVRLLDSILSEERVVAQNTGGIFWLIVLGYLVALVAVIVAVIVIL